MTTESAGNFSFSAVTPGGYSIIVERPGFKRLAKHGLTVNPNETTSAGELRLEVGQVSDSVSVTAEGETVQVASSERSGIITHNQVENLTTINRDFAALVTLLPGVVENAGAETQGFGSNSTFNVQGARITSNSVVIDGMPVTQPNGTDTGTYMAIDAVSAVQLTTSSYQAEFGRKPGAAIQAVTKNGGQEYHGAAYWYKRHEMFNANSFFNNRQSIPEARYRYTTAGGNFGGPLLIPGITHRDRRRAFFFVSSEQLREARPQPIRTLTTPTAAERAGDFSNSRDTNNALIVIKDPVTKLAFPNNIIPLSRIVVPGQKYLDLLPLPNALNTAVTKNTRRMKPSTYDCVVNLWPHVVPQGYAFIDEYSRLDYCASFSQSVSGRSTSTPLLSDRWEPVRASVSASTFSARSGSVDALCNRRRALPTRRTSHGVRTMFSLAIRAARLAETRDPPGDSRPLIAAHHPPGPGCALASGAVRTSEMTGTGLEWVAWRVAVLSPWSSSLRHVDGAYSEVSIV